MSFRIACAASYSYRPVVELTMPSWQANAKADRIDVAYYPDPPRARATSPEGINRRWLTNAVQRVRLYRELVQEAVRSRHRLLLLDADCYVLKPLMRGFDGGKPVAIARWPNPNIGVIFLDCALDWPFLDLFDDWLAAIAGIEEMDAAAAPDQAAFNTLLREHEDRVSKLDNRVWNFPYGSATTADELTQYRDKMRILHLRIRHLDNNVKHPVIRRLQQHVFFSVIAGIDPRRRRP